MIQRRAIRKGSVELLNTGPGRVAGERIVGACCFRCRTCSTSAFGAFRKLRRTSTRIGSTLDTLCEPTRRHRARPPRGNQHRPLGFRPDLSDEETTPAGLRKLTGSAAEEGDLTPPLLAILNSPRSHGVWQAALVFHGMPVNDRLDALVTVCLVSTGISDARRRRRKTRPNQGLDSLQNARRGQSTGPDKFLHWTRIQSHPPVDELQIRIGILRGLHFLRTRKAIDHSD